MPFYGHFHFATLSLLVIRGRWVHDTFHMPPEDIISQKVVTIKTVCSIKAFRILGVKLHNFQNTFHQLFWRYGNPDMHFLGTLKIEFPILDV